MNAMQIVLVLCFIGSKNEKRPMHTLRADTNFFGIFKNLPLVDPAGAWIERVYVQAHLCVCVHGVCVCVWCVLRHSFYAFGTKTPRYHTSW